MNQFIINPINGEKVSILSKHGLRLLKTYIMAFKNGGSESAAAESEEYLSVPKICFWEKQNVTIQFTTKSKRNVFNYMYD